MLLRFFLKKTLTHRSLWSNADQVLVFVNDDFDVSEGEDSDFEGTPIVQMPLVLFLTLKN